ncbi:hypothetical protein H0H87_012664, partial [Tephrocybe sp. NHM501043]
MKYSTAIVVACIGGAALVAAENNTTNPAATPQLPPGRSHKIATVVGKTAKHLGTFAQSATGNPPIPAYASLKRRTTPAPRPRLSQKAKTTLRTAVNAAGGGSQLAESAGNVASLLKSVTPPSQVPPSEAEVAR